MLRLLWILSDSEDSDVDFCFNSDEGSVAELEWNT